MTTNETPSTLPLSSDNIAMEVEKAGKTWKDYVESGNGCGALNSGTYYVRHDPLEYFTNINKANIVCSPIRYGPGQSCAPESFLVVAERLR